MVRFYLPSLFPKVKRLLYLDNDIIVTCCLEEVWSTKMTESQIIGEASSSTIFISGYSLMSSSRLVASCSSFVSFCSVAHIPFLIISPTCLLLFLLFLLFRLFRLFRLFLLLLLCVQVSR